MRITVLDRVLVELLEDGGWRVWYTSGDEKRAYGELPADWRPTRTNFKTLREALTRILNEQGE